MFSLLFILFSIYLVEANQWQWNVHSQEISTPLGVPYKGPLMNVSHHFISNEHVQFIEHTEGNYKWLGMNLNYDYVRPLFDLLNSTDQVLQNRNEAHITVISPPEYDILAASGMTIDEINSIALDMSIQSSVFDIICIGKEDVIVNRERSVVYQFIVHSPNLLAIRRKIFQLYSDYNGNTALFDPESYWPHVTIGYTLTDVFVQHGVYKGSNVCYSPVLIDYEQ